MKTMKMKGQFRLQHGRYLENWYLEAGLDLGTADGDTEAVL